MVMGTFLFKEELSVTESLCLAESLQMQGCVKDFFPAWCMHKDLPSVFEMLIKATRNKILPRPLACALHMAKTTTLWQRKTLHFWGWGRGRSALKKV